MTSFGERGHTGYILRVTATPARRLAGLALDALLLVVTLGIGWLVWSWFEWGHARTPGMRLVRLHVERGDGAATRGRMAAREVLWKGLALLAGLVSFGVLWWAAAAPVLGRRRRALWDVAAGTDVVGTREVERGTVRRVVGRTGAGAGLVAVTAATALLAVMWIPASATVVSNVVTGERADELTGTPATARCTELRPEGRVETQGRAADGATLRVFTIGYHLRVSDAEDYATYRDRMRCLMEDEVVPHLEPGQPALVVYPEDVGLPAVALGARGATVRAQAEGPLRAVSPDVPLALAGALGQFNLGYGPQIAAYQARFGGVDPRKQAMLAATDTAVRSFARTFSEIASDYGVYVVASNNMADYRVTTDPAEVAIFADPEAQPTDRAYVATSSRVTNSTFLWGPDVVDPDAPDYLTNLLAKNEKIPLTPLELDLLGLDEGPATGPEALENAAPVDVAGFAVGMATSLPAFRYGYPFGDRPAGFDPCADLRESYEACQDELGVEVVLQADANPGQWPAPGGHGEYQPLEWMGSVWRQVADPTVSTRYNVTPMMTGNLFDLTFDGQSTISERGASGGGMHLVGIDAAEPEDGDEWRVYAGDKSEFLVMSPWVVDSDDRDELRATAAELAGGSGADRENDYVESVLWADLVPAE
ncbi:RDD family protein [Paraoerskovia marina]|uniref:RDD family protein n=1 Tax=Paraoerskovia marina TaxID=545619 RepID=A0A1H1NED4_9CELL|nr:RDD family protein [Paraoerskovia marina]